MATDMPVEWIVPPFFGGGLTAIIVWRNKTINPAVGWASPFVGIILFLSIAWFGYRGPIMMASMTAFLSTFSWLTLGCFLRQKFHFGWGRSD